MSETVSIKVVIAGRTYPLTVAMEEEEYIRKAAKEIDESVRVFQENYAVRDKQDLLAMTALQFLTQKHMDEQKTVQDNIGPELNELNTFVKEYLVKNS